MKFIKTNLAQAGLAILIFCLAGTRLSAVTLKELQDDAELTPDRFAAYFADFKFKLREKVQSPEAFLAAQDGDCDDYAILAADLLKAKGYTTRLVVVFMPKDIHVVCYVAETKSYLDFNGRNSPTPTVACDEALCAIADKVAQSFRASWHCVSEFKFKDGIRHFVYTDFPQAKGVTEPRKQSKIAPKTVAFTRP
jgi:hypothetical protein